MASLNSAEDVDAEHKPSGRTFESLGLDSWLVQALSAMSIKRPTPIQATCIGPILEGKILARLALNDRTGLYRRCKDWFG